MNPSEAKRRIWIYGISGCCIAIYSLLTIIISCAKGMYVHAFQGISHTSSGLIQALFGNYFRWFKSLEIPDLLVYWWMKAPTPLIDVNDYNNMLMNDNYWFAFHFLLFFPVKKLLSMKRNLVEMLNNAKRRKQEKEWENHPDL